MKIKHRETGEESIVQVPISDAEFEKIMALQNEYDKQVLMLGIARARGLVPELIGDSDASNV